MSDETGTADLDPSHISVVHPQEEHEQGIRHLEEYFGLEQNHDQHHHDAAAEPDHHLEDHGSEQGPDVDTAHAQLDASNEGSFNPAIDDGVEEGDVRRLTENAVQAMLQQSEASAEADASGSASHGAEGGVEVDIGIEQPDDAYRHDEHSAYEYSGSGAVSRSFYAESGISGIEPHDYADVSFALEQQHQRQEQRIRGEDEQAQESTQFDNVTSGHQEGGEQSTSGLDQSTNNHSIDDVHVVPIDFDDEDNLQAVAGPSKRSRREKNSEPSSSSARSRNRRDPPSAESLAAKKMAHIASEQRRRAQIRSGYEALYNVIPTLKDAALVNGAQRGGSGPGGGGAVGGRKRDREAMLAIVSGASQSPGPVHILSDDVRSLSATKRRRGRRGKSDPYPYGEEARTDPANAGPSTSGENEERGGGVNLEDSESQRNAIAPPPDMTDGRQGPRSESVVLQKTIEYLREQHDQRLILKKRLESLRAAIAEKLTPEQRESLGLSGPELVEFDVPINFKKTKRGRSLNQESETKINSASSHRTSVSGRPISHMTNSTEDYRPQNGYASHSADPTANTINSALHDQSREGSSSDAMQMTLHAEAGLGHEDYHEEVPSHAYGPQPTSSRNGSSLHETIQASSSMETISAPGIEDPETGDRDGLSAESPSGYKGQPDPSLAPESTSEFADPTDEGRPMVRQRMLVDFEGEWTGGKLIDEAETQTV